MENDIESCLINWFEENSDISKDFIQENQTKNYFLEEWIDSLKFIILISDLENSYSIQFSPNLKPCLASESWVQPSFMACGCFTSSWPGNYMKNRMKELRARDNITQAQLANMVGVRRETIVFLEKGKYNPSLSLAHAVAQVFNLTIEEVFLFEKTDSNKKTIE